MSAADRGSRRAIPSSSIVVVGLLLTGEVLAQKTTSAPKSPQILALSLGVEEYADTHLSGCRDDAKRFAETIHSSYPTAEIVLAIDAKDAPLQPTVSTVREFLDLRIPALPPNSLFILYFAGHGVLHEYPSQALPSELCLLTSGARASPASRFDYQNYVTLSEIILSISRRPLIQFMVFLDCCHAGGLPSLGRLATEQQLAASGIRGFVLAASSVTQITRPHIFMDALLSVWRAPVNDPLACVLPRDLETLVNAAIPDILQNKYPKIDRSRPLITSELVLGDGIVQCMGEMSQDSCLLIFLLPTPFRPPVSFDFKRRGVFLATAKDAANGVNPIFIKQVPRKELAVTVAFSGGSFRPKTLNYSAEDLAGGIRVEDLSGAVASADMKGVGLRYLDTGRLALGLGVNGQALGDVFLKGLRILKRAIPASQVAVAAQSVLAEPIDDERFRAARDEGEPVFSNTTAILQAIELVELAENHRHAARLARQFANSRRGAEDRKGHEYGLLRAWVNYQKAGDGSEAELAYDELSQSASLSERQRTVLAMMASRPSDIGQPFAFQEPPPFEIWYDLGREEPASMPQPKETEDQRLRRLESAGEIQLVPLEHTADSCLKSCDVVFTSTTDGLVVVRAGESRYFRIDKQRDEYTASGGYYWTCCGSPERSRITGATYIKVTRNEETGMMDQYRVEIVSRR